MMEIEGERERVKESESESMSMSKRRARSTGRRATWESTIVLLSSFCTIFQIKKPGVAPDPKKSTKEGEHETEIESGSN